MTFKLRELIPCLLCSCIFKRDPQTDQSAVNSLYCQTKSHFTNMMLGASQVRHIAPEALVVSLDIALS